MLNIWAIAKKEYRHYFISPIAYISALMFFGFLGLIFYFVLIQSLATNTAPNVQIVTGPLTTLLLFATPALTMGALSEEQKSGTIEVLLTSPVRDWEVVVGKWLGCYLFLLTIILLTCIYTILLNRVVSPGIDLGLTVAAYLGVILFSASISAIGVGISTLYSNQIAAFFSTLAIMLLLWIINLPAGFASGLLGDILRYLSITDHFYESFQQGTINIKDIVYYLSLVAIGLFTGSTSLESRRWR